MESTKTYENKYKKNDIMIIYNMRYATQLIQLGHTVLTTMPNAKNPGYTVWVFAIDATFIDDFNKIKGGARIGK